MMSWAVAFRLRQYAKSSLWIIPLFGLLLGAILARLAQALDGTFQLPADWRYSASTASTVLSAIVGAMVGLLGFVVTIGVLVVQQATGTLSPRYMRLWYRDRLQKSVLATFAGTFAFAFSLLRSVEEDSVPDLGVTLAGLAVAVSLLLLLIYLNRFTHNLRPVAIADLVTRFGERVLARWVAEVGLPAVQYGEHGKPLPGEARTLVRSERAGSIQAFHVAGLKAAAVRHGCTFVLTHPVGDFVPAGTTLIEVHGGTSQPDPRQLMGLVALGVERTIEQDPAFALRILVDIAIRALSPAVNDPTTAVQILDHIEEFLHVVGRNELRADYAIGDDRGRPLLLFPGRTWEDYLQLAVTEIRDFGVRSTQTCRRLRALLEGLLDVLPDRHLAAVRAELRLLDESVQRNFTDPAGRATAQVGDRQGIGGGRPRPSTPPG
ncbi:DUF2254 domain-containing protein [Streptomyces lunaelactis]|uniref:DUF2254 domain-containing protein n=1 Tax=Streptomyces lunaelactis TaxID=1535768 RepID=UPI001FE645A1|nr:DUF2254 domain-containing protein [Streptomyces lunaelactis]